MYFTRRRFVPPFGRLGLLLLAIAFVAHRATATLAQTAACTGVSLSDSPPFQAPIGTPVTLAASSTGCFSPQYRFWVEAPGQPWTLMQDYSFGSAFTWDTRDLPAGDYNVEADARGWGSTADVEAYQVQAYALQPLPACSLRGLGTRPAGQARAGTPVVLIASSSGCPAPQYRFWVEAPGQPWTLMQDYSYLSSFVWNTA
ncbi:MAG: hypothetical protein ACR2PL_12320, partial [Dehalococcoidia bacterium]